MNKLDKILRPEETAPLQLIALLEGMQQSLEKLNERLKPLEEKFAAKHD